MALIVLLLATLLAPASPLSTPTRGWNTWNSYQCNISEGLVLTQAQAIVKNGLQELYPYVVIDDCWMDSSRDEVTGRLKAHPVRFPNGMLSLTEKLHAMG